MQSSTHIGKIVRQHADAVEHGKSASRKSRGKNGPQKALKRVSSFTSVPKHRAFVPMVTIWGGLLLALITAVMPDQPIARVSSLTGIYLPLLMTRIILSLGIGLAGALLGYIVASALSHRAKLMDGEGGLVSALKSRDVRPIDPVYDLGSESLDAPLDTVNPHEMAEPAEYAEMEDAAFACEAAGNDNAKREPNLGELAKRGYDIEAPEDIDDASDREDEGGWAFTRKHFKDALIESCEGGTCEAARGPDTANQPVKAQAPQNPTPKPRSLDLGEFASLPKRNGVWVEEQRETLETPNANMPFAAAQENKAGAVMEDQPAADVRAESEKEEPANALEKLRQKPAENLSLVEMVERFAGALHDHQTQERARAVDSEITREAALAEALKALALFTERGFDQGVKARPDDNALGQTEDELRSALARLQDLRGAA